MRRTVGRALTVRRCPRHSPPQTPIRSRRATQTTVGLDRRRRSPGRRRDGLAIYASTSSDLDDANARSPPSRNRSIRPGHGADVVAAAKSAYDDLSAQLGAAQEDASQTAEQAAERLDQAEQAAAEAQGTAEEVQKQADAAQAKAEAAATCAQSFRSAFSGVFSGATLREGVEATVAELQALQP